MRSQQPFLNKFLSHVEQHEWELDPLLNIVGFRFKPFRPDTFNDLLFVFWTEGLVWRGMWWVITTLPGVPYLLQPIYPKGTAILVPGQYKDCYRVGLHRGKYDALVQCKPVRVYRDANKDTLIDENQAFIETGNFGINIHRASLFSRFVGLNSAGCQVFKDSGDFSEFMGIVLSYGNKTYTYNLIEIEELL